MEINKELFSNQVREGMTVKELMDFYGITRTKVYAYKNKWDLVGESPNSKRRLSLEGEDLTYKVCNKCTVNKPLSDFYSNGYRPDGTRKFKPSCKDCENKHKKDAFKDKILWALNQQGRKYECECCGYKRNSAALVFHHNKGEKNFEISSSYKTISKEELAKEIALCAVLCQNCHMEFHYPLHSLEK